MQSVACLKGECWDCLDNGIVGDVEGCTCECHRCPLCDERSEDVAGGPCQACWDTAPRHSDHDKETIVTETSTAERELLPIQYLVLEVLAARHRLGESHWTFPNEVRPAIEALAEADLVEHKAGVTAGTTKAWLTEQGRHGALSESYTLPKIHVTYGPDPNANTGLNRAAVQEAYELGLTHGRRGWMR